MSKITKVHSREILDSRGFPTLEVEITTEKGMMARAAVPSGASTGAHEACELRDGDKGRYMGKGVSKAVSHVNNEIAKTVIGMNCQDWKKVDEAIIALDGTQNKTRLGANAILGTSLACAKVAALEEGAALYQYLGGDTATTLPIPLMNVLNGGAHADNGLDVQEFMVVPRLETFSRSLQAGSEIFHALKKALSDKGLTVAVGDEGGFAPKLKGNRQALDFLSQAVESAGYRLGEQVYFALDVAATEFFNNGKYTWEGEACSAEQLTEIYKDWKQKYPLISIEDGLAEDDWDGWHHITKEIGNQVQLVGDDLFVTNYDRLTQGVEKHCANALLVKVNQIGSLSETEKAVRFAQKSNYQTVMSHRSGETEDTTIADLSVAFNCSQIKTGSLCRSERIAKYNQLLRIEEALGAKAQFAMLDLMK
ncbi:MAG: phosphopyruvate hydratase [Bdellovibrionales bacterium]|nr:phosphopyruvate hydratase [Bdellovibrionales bacterium]